MCHVQQIAPSLRKKGNILLVLDTLILFQMAFKTQEIRTFLDKLIFKVFRRSMSPDPPLKGRAFGARLYPPPLQFSKACYHPERYQEARKFLHNLSLNFSQIFLVSIMSIIHFGTAIKHVRQSFDFFLCPLSVFNAERLAMKRHM